VKNFWKQKCVKKDVYVLVFGSVASGWE